MEEKAIMIAKGHGADLILFKNKIRIKRKKGVSTFVIHSLKGDKDIFLKSVSAIQFRKAGMITSGYIQFTLMGGVESARGLWGAVHDENTVVFTKKQENDFIKIKELIEKEIHKK